MISFRKLSKALSFSVFLFVYFVYFVVSSSAAEPTYWQDVRPLLRKHCTVCHSAKHLREPEVSGGLALDSYEAVRKGAKEPVIQPGKSADSLLMKMVLLKDDQK